MYIILTFEKKSTLYPDAYSNIYCTFYVNFLDTIQLMSYDNCF